MLTKHWIPGYVKTRLGKAVGMASAATIHRSFVTFLGSQLSSVGVSRHIAVAPDNYLSPFFEEFTDRVESGDQWNIVHQGQGDLGCRICRAVDQIQSINLERPKVIVIGADCLTISPDELNAAAGKLVDFDVVIGPAVDGGYYLIGFQNPLSLATRSLFDDIPWGTGDVLTATIDKLEEAKLSYTLLTKKRDIDTIEDVEATIKEIRNTPPIDSQLFELSTSLADLLSDTHHDP